LHPRDDVFRAVLEPALVAVPLPGTFGFNTPLRHPAASS
jgi:hypothetical protein